MLNLKNKTQLLAWQALFLLLATSWLWATHLNPSLSYRSSLISQYEIPHQPYSWLFRTCDVLAGFLLLNAAYFYLNHIRTRTAGIMLMIISFGLILDPVVSTNCRIVGNVCHEYFSANFVLHGIETIATAGALFVASVYDARQRRKVVSIAFVLFQIAYGILFLTQLADQDHFNTVSQYIYQTLLICWLAWFCRDYLEDIYPPSKHESVTIKLAASGWAFINGILAIILALAHLNLVGRIRGAYFGGNNAWLAQHGVIIGVVMLYLSRHLVRGERRARQIFLLIIGIEVIKYSVVAPNGVWLGFYLITFVALFITRDSFQRGALPLTWRLRVKDLLFMISGLLLATITVLIALDRDNRASVVASRSLDNFFDYVAANNPVAKDHLSSLLLADTISVFILTAALSILWILFRPNKIGLRRNAHKQQISKFLGRYSRSTEDFFKQWPPDKNYYWSKNQEGFVAYKIVGSTAFGLADPISANKGKMIDEFKEWCVARRLKVCFLPVYPNSSYLYEKHGFELMQIGSSAEINIAEFITSTIKDKWWRWQLNRGAKAGYEYAKLAPPHPAGFIRELKKVSNAWLKTGGHTERGFALGYFDEKYLGSCVIHYLKASGGEVIAFTNELPQFNPGKTVTVDLLRYKPQPKTPMPFLLANMIQELHKDSPTAKTFDLGFVPFAKAKGPLLAIAQAFSRDIFSSRGLEQFKNKFDPVWQPNYMAYEGDLADLAVIALNIEKLMER